MTFADLRACEIISCKAADCIFAYNKAYEPHIF